MCRHIGYIGKKKNINDVLIKKEHSLMDMSYKPKEMENAILNADGFGIGWYAKKKLFVYKNYLPIWNDYNLSSITENIESKLIIGNVRSATLNENTSYQNTHPFKFKNFIFSHNGYIENFQNSVKLKIIKLIDDNYLSEIKGNTDSEYIFFLILQIYKKEKTLSKSIKIVLNILKDMCDSAMLNFLIAHYKDEKLYLIATKAAINLNSPSLYIYNEKEKFTYISSEKLDKNNWRAVKDSCLIECNHKIDLIVSEL